MKTTGNTFKIDQELIRVGLKCGSDVNYVIFYFVRFALRLFLYLMS